MQDFILILLFGVSAAWLAKRFGQPAAVAQVLVGLAIGPPLLGWIEPGEELQLIGQLGVTLLLGMAGLHIGLKPMVREGWVGLWVALFGMLFCLAGGYGFAAWYGSPLPEAVYVGTALTATSIGISVQVLHQLNLINHKVGRVVVAAAVIDDVLALYLLAIAHGVLSEELVTTQIAISIPLAAVILMGIYLSCWGVGKRLLEPLFKIQNSFSLLTIIALILSFGWLTEAMGYSLVVGGFFAGLGLGDGLNQMHRDILVKQLDRLVLILIQFFFVLVGSRAEWGVFAEAGLPNFVFMLCIHGRSQA